MQKAPTLAGAKFSAKKALSQSILSRNRLCQQMLHQLRNLMHQSLMRRRISWPGKSRMDLANPPVAS